MKKIFQKLNLKSKARDASRGFTLVETVIAILILSLSVGSLLTLAAGGFFSVRYARNQIVADNLAQEALEYIRNSRDTAVLQGTTWATWLSTLDVDVDGDTVGGLASGCFDSDGCTVDPYTSGKKIKACSGTCPSTLLYPDEGFYGYQGGAYPFSGGTAPITTSYIRKVTTTLDSADHLTVNVILEWRNGTAVKTVSQAVLLTNWNI